MVLICHGLQSELRILDDLGVFLEDLPITGVIDTHEVSRDVLGHSGSLEHLLSTLSIPWRYGMMHNAGNDAHYTMRLLLALLQIRHGDPTGCFNELARQPLPERNSWKMSDEMEKEDDWTTNLDCGPILIIQ